ncbi:MAG: hypothetical protein Phog2KO_35250 [Phototrophicaceae bacterium]
MTVTSTIQISQLSQTVTQANARQHRVLIDRPEAVGGTDRGPKARELFLMSFGGCFMKNLQGAIEARSSDIRNIQIEVIGTATQSPNRFVSIELHIHANYEDKKLMTKLVTIAERGCLIANTLKHLVDLSFVIH